MLWPQPTAAPWSNQLLAPPPLPPPWPRGPQPTQECDGRYGRWGRIFHLPSFLFACDGSCGRWGRSPASSRGLAHPCEMEAVEERFFIPIRRKGRIPPPPPLCHPSALSLLYESTSSRRDDDYNFFGFPARKRHARRAQSPRNRATNVVSIMCTSSYVCVPHATGWPATRE